MFATLVFSGCNDMDNEPSGTYGEDEFWASVDRAQYLLNMIYNQHYSATMMWSDETLSDNLMRTRDYGDERVIRNGNAETTTPIFASTWKNLYGGIKTANMFLANIDRLKADPKQINGMKAQARYLRAWMYLRLTEFYGNVPYFTHELSVADSKRVTRTPHVQIMRALHTELDSIMPHLPRRDDLTDDQRGQITCGAAVALQARAYLYDGDWAKAERYCNMLISQQEKYGHYSLFPNYAALFTQEAEYNEEIIADCEYAPKVRVWEDMFNMAPLSVEIGRAHV